MSMLNIPSDVDNQLLAKLIELTYALSEYEQMNGGLPKPKLSEQQVDWSTFGDSSSFYNPWRDSSFFGNQSNSNNNFLNNSTNSSQNSSGWDAFLNQNSNLSSLEPSSFDIKSFMRELTSGQQQDITNNNYPIPSENSFLSSLLSNEPAHTSSNSSTRSSSPDDRSHIEQVQVESSAHVSYIVGKQGSKIRQIRTETETHIQTPVNGEEPIFVLKGRKANVQRAKERILIEAHNYSMTLYNQARSFKDGERRQANIYLPVRFIGLVVGKKGTSIKRIMELSGADIVTPKVNTINGFKIFGTEQQIRSAVDHIKMHIMTNNNVTIVEETNMFEITLRIMSK